jgi:hypothetical protein
MDRLILGFYDGRSSMLSGRSPKYLDERVHGYLPRFRKERKLDARSLALRNDIMRSGEACDRSDQELLDRPRRWRDWWIPRRERSAIGWQTNLGRWRATGSARRRKRTASARQPMRSAEPDPNGAGLLDSVDSRHRFPEAGRLWPSTHRDRPNGA